nr:argininosuccinate synthase [Vicinamibacterales bacterium]
RTTCPDHPATLEIEFVQGLPTRVNGVAMGPVELLASLDTIAGAHGVGRIDRMMPGPSGATSRAVVEAPAAVVLTAAHREVVALAQARELEDVARVLGRMYADLIEQGRWYSPAREAIDAFVDRAQRDVTGIARLELFKGSCLVTGRGAPRASHPS